MSTVSCSWLPEASAWQIEAWPDMFQPRRNGLRRELGSRGAAEVLRRANAVVAGGKVGRDGVAQSGYAINQRSKNWGRILSFVNIACCPQSDQPSRGLLNIS